MATLSITQQMLLLAQQIEKSSTTSERVIDEIIGYIRQYSTAATPESVATVLSALEKKHGIMPSDVLRKPDEKQVEPFLNPVFPTTGWIGDYMQYTLNQESPDLYHFWVATCVLQAAVRRNVWFEHGYFRVYPNSYIVLVGPSGKCRKTAAMDIGVNLLKQVPGIAVATEKITPEAVVKALHDAGRPAADTHGGTGLQITRTSAALVYASELAVFLGQEKYNAGMIALMTTLYDCHDVWESSTIGRGKTRLENIHLCLLAGVTPDLVAQTIPAIAMGGGFMSRTIFVVRERTPRCYANPIPRDPLMREKLAASLQRISETRSVCIQSAAALRWHEEWYAKHHAREGDELSLSGYYERKQSHLIKLAMTLLISEGGDMIITPDVYERALAILEFTERSMPLAMAKVHNSEIGQLHELVVSHLKRNKGTLTRSALLRKVYGRMDSAKLNVVMTTLLEAGMVGQQKADLSKGSIEYILLRSDL